MIPNFWGTLEVTAAELHLYFVIKGNAWWKQWRTQKIFMGVSFNGIWWSFAFGVRCLRRHNWTSYYCFQTNVLAKFVDILCIFFYTHSP